MRDICVLCMQIIFFATSYVTPLALICGLYLWLLLRLWRGAAPGGHVSEESRRGKRRVTRMVVVVVAIFAVCWFPIQVGIGSGIQLCHSRVLEILWETSSLAPVSPDNFHDK
jgi:hypothetical protein